VIAFVVAGTDTTAILITQMVRALHREGLWDQVRDNRELVPKALEETLRHAGVVRGLNRVVTKDVELSGVTIPAGSTIYWSCGSAGRDEEHFEAPDEFRLNRPEISDHVAFSALRHFCIGAPLARVEAEQALGALLDRIPNMTVPEQEVEYHPNFVTPTPVSLKIEWSEKTA
jgi:cytochrome P450